MWLNMTVAYRWQSKQRQLQCGKCVCTCCMAICVCCQELRKCRNAFIAGAKTKLKQTLTGTLVDGDDQKYLPTSVQACTMTTLRNRLTTGPLIHLWKEKTLTITIKILKEQRAGFGVFLWNCTKTTLMLFKKKKKTQIKTIPKIVKKYSVRLLLPLLLPFRTFSQSVPSSGQSVIQESPFDFQSVFFAHSKIKTD